MGIPDLYQYFVFVLKCVLHFVFYPYMVTQCRLSQPSTAVWNLTCGFNWYEPVIGFFVLTFVSIIVKYCSKEQPVIGVAVPVFVDGGAGGMEIIARS